MTGIQHDFLQDPAVYNYQDRKSGQQAVFEHQPAVAHDDGCWSSSNCSSAASGNVEIQHERLQVIRGDVLEPASFQHTLI